MHTKVCIYERPLYDQVFVHKSAQKKSVLIEKLKQLVICSVRYGLGDVVDL